MGCLGTTPSFIVHVVALYDLLFYAFFVVYHARRFSSVLLMLSMNINMFVIFLVSYMHFLGEEDIHFSSALIGIGIAAVFTVPMLFGTMAFLAETMLVSLLLVSAQLTSTYMPHYLERQYGLDTRYGSTVTLTFPVIIFFAARAAATSDVAAGVATATSLAFLVTLGLGVWRRAYWPNEPVCCEMSGDCPLWFAHWELALVGLLAFVVCVLKFRDFFVLQLCSRCNFRSKQSEQTQNERQPDPVRQAANTSKLGDDSGKPLLK